MPSFFPRSLEELVEEMFITVYAAFQLAYRRIAYAPQHIRHAICPYFLRCTMYRADTITKTVPRYHTDRFAAKMNPNISPAK